MGAGVGLPPTTEVGYILVLLVVLKGCITLAGWLADLLVGWFACWLVGGGRGAKPLLRGCTTDQRKVQRKGQQQQVRNGDIAPDTLTPLPSLLRICITF